MKIPYKQIIKRKPGSISPTIFPATIVTDSVCDYNKLAMPCCNYYSSFKASNLNY